ncbi:MAG: hypothetical protein J5585_02760 [Clostridia bacterium]|nr:hypothetical protein [Clostridia bacterium]
MRNYAIDALNKNSALIIFRDSKNGFSSYPSITTSNSLIYEINNEEGAISDKVDPFSCFSDSETNSYLIDMFDSYSEIDKSKRMSYQNYIALIRSLLKKRGKSMRLNELINMSFEEVERLNSIVQMPESERNRNERFLNSFLPDVRELEAYFIYFSANMTGEILSGTKTMEKIFQSKDIIEINLDFTSKQKESEILMSVMIDNICKLNLAAANKAFVAVIANGVPNDVLIKTKFNKLIKNAHSCGVVYSVADITNLIEQSNEWIEYADSYFFFKQNSNKNKEFCSEFFGTYEKTKETRISGTSKPTIWAILNGQGSSSQQNSKSYTTEKERVYLPDVFASLPENQAIYYFKKTNEHSRLTVFK